MGSLITLLAAFLAFLAAITNVRAAPIDSGRIVAVDRLFQRWDTSTSPGCAVAVMNNGHIVYERGYGMADLDHGVEDHSYHALLCESRVAPKRDSNKAEAIAPHSFSPVNVRITS
jgi:hypothetical protein